MILKLFDRPRADSESRMFGAIVSRAVNRVLGA